MAPVSRPAYIGEYTITPIFCCRQKGRISPSISRSTRSDGSNCLSTPYLAYTEIRYPDKLHLAFFFQSSQFGPPFLDVLVWFGPMDLVQINCIYLQPAQAIFAFAADRLSLQAGSNIAFLVPDSLALSCFHSTRCRQWPRPQFRLE